MSSLQTRIARRARVSQSTVSRALSNNPVLPRSTCRRIQAIARQMGYVPNPLVSSVFGAMRRRQSRTNLGTLAFLTAHATRNGWKSIATYRDFFVGAEERAAEQGFAIETHWAAEPGLTGTRLGGILAARGILGVIVSTRGSTEAFPELPWENFALVRIGLSQRRLPFHCAVNHQFQTARLVAGQLAARGYVRIGLAMTTWQNEASDQGWLGGFLVWQQSQPASRRLPVNLLPALTAETFLDWFGHHRPDAVISVNPDVAIWLRTTNHRVPEDVGVALLDWHDNYGDIAGADQNSRLAGSAAVDILLGQLRRNERGIPAHPHTLLIESSWREGAPSGRSDCHEGGKDQWASLVWPYAGRNRGPAFLPRSQCPDQPQDHAGRREIGLTNQNYSLLVTAFMAPYIFTYFFAGGWVDRYGTRSSVAVFVLGMSIATVLCGLAENKWQMAGARVLLGVAEAGIMPAVFVAITQWFPVDRKATAVAIAAPVGALGSILAPVFVATVTLRWGWREAFWIPGIAGLGVMVLWWAVEKVPAASPGRRPAILVREVLADRAFRGLFAVRILTDPFWFLLQFWQAAFVQERLGLSLGAAARLLWIPPLGQTALGIALGWYSDRLIRRGMPARRARAVILAGITALTPCVFILAWTHTTHLAIGMLIVTQFICHGWLGGTTLLASEIAPPGRMASVIGVMSALGGISSVLLGAAAGALVDRFGYSVLFTLAAVVFPVAGLIVWRCYLAKQSPFVLERPRLQGMKWRVERVVPNAPVPRAISHSALGTTRSTPHPLPKISLQDQDLAAAAVANRALPASCRKSACARWPSCPAPAPREGRRRPR